jgi:hypothetical protein
MSNVPDPSALADCERRGGAGWAIGAGCEIPRGTASENFLALTRYGRRLILPGRTFMQLSCLEG